MQSLTPIRETVEQRAAAEPDLRDVFLCHACGDRQGAAKGLSELRVAAGVKVWFSDDDLPLGVPMMRAFDPARDQLGLALPPELLPTPPLVLRGLELLQEP